MASAAARAWWSPMSPRVARRRRRGSAGATSSSRSIGAPSAPSTSSGKSWAASSRANPWPSSSSAAAAAVESTWSSRRPRNPERARPGALMVVSDPTRPKPAVLIIDDERDVRYLRAEPDRAHAVDALVGRHPSMVRLDELIAQVAQTPAAGLIGAESGTGKELVARAIHRQRPRRDQPFVAVNRAAIPDT